MPDKSIEVQLAILVTEMGHIKSELADAKTARKGQYEKMEEQSQTLATMDGRMKVVEDSLKQQAPTIEEFITIKHKVVGAGVFGRWTWVVLAFLIGTVASLRSQIFHWLSRAG